MGDNMKHSSKNGFIFNGRTQQQRGNNIKYITFILMIVALIIFVVSCSAPPIVTEEAIIILDVKELADGSVKVATSINYHGSEWLEDITLSFAEYTRYKGQKNLKVKAIFKPHYYYDGGRIEFYLNGNKIKIVRISEELANNLVEKLQTIETLKTTTENPVE